MVHKTAASHLLRARAQIRKVCGSRCCTGDVVSKDMMGKVLLLRHKRAVCALAAPDQIKWTQASRLRALADHALAVRKNGRRGVASFNALWCAFDGLHEFGVSQAAAPRARPRYCSESILDSSHSSVRATRLHRTHKTRAS
jgi:hypothetical protein